MHGRCIALLCAVFATGCGDDLANGLDAADDAASLDAGEDAAPTDAPILDASALDASAPPIDSAAPLPDSAADGPTVSWMVPCLGAVIARDVFTSKSDFSPEHVAINAGDVVRFQPLNPHDVRAGTYAAPETWFFVPGNVVGCVRFDQPGIYDFYCNAHPFSMTGTVTVTP